VWTVEAVRVLGMTTDVDTAAAILGFGRTKAYELAKNNQFPVQTLRIGRPLRRTRISDPAAARRRLTPTHGGRVAPRRPPAARNVYRFSHRAGSVAASRADRKYNRRIGGT
jgi:hypothetical protein